MTKIVIIVYSMVPTEYIKLWFLLFFCRYLYANANSITTMQPMGNSAALSIEWGRRGTYSTHFTGVSYGICVSLQHIMFIQFLLDSYYFLFNQFFYKKGFSSWWKTKRVPLRQYLFVHMYSGFVATFMVILRTG
jgi:hypothetical protein